MNPMKPRLCPEISIEVSSIDTNAVGNINTSSNRIKEYLTSLWQLHYLDVLLGESRDNLTLGTKVPLQGSIASHISHQFQFHLLMSASVANLGRVSVVEPWTVQNLEYLRGPQRSQ
jgi:hypothetical protein